MFVETAAEENLKEIERAKMGAERGGPEVKALANRLITDHAKAGSELSALAGKRGITLPSVPEEGASMHFGQKSGAPFDKEFLRMMLSDHQKDIALFEKESKTGSDPDWRTGQVKRFQLCDCTWMR